MSSAALVALAPALALLPIGYALWWVDRHRLAPLPRYLAVLALATAVGAWLAASWPGALVAGTLQVGPAPRAPRGALAALVIHALPSLRLVLAALAVLLFLLARGEDVEVPLDGAIFGIACGVGLWLPAGWVAAAAVDRSGGALATGALVPVGIGAVVGLAVACARLELRWLPRLAIVAAGTVAGLMIANGAAAAVAGAGHPWPAATAGAAALAAALAVAVLIEVRVGGRELREEATLGVLPEWASEVGPRYWRRVRSGWWPRRDERRAVSSLLLDLAFRKHQLRHLGDERTALYSLEVGRLRERARGLLEPRPAAIGTLEESEP